jgi:hypothetical protein
MKTTRYLVSGVLLAALALSVAAPIHAEFTGQYIEGDFNLIVLAIIEDPDPVPTAVWEIVREGTSGEILNLEGSQRGDGPPDVYFNSQTGRPVVTWAYRTAGDHDIVINEWMGDGWSENDFITSSTINEVDPRVHVDAAGRAYVVWWTDDLSQEVMLSEREANSQHWTDPLPVTATGRRPSVLRADGQTLVAFERDRDGGGQEIVVATISEGGGIGFQTVATTSRTFPLDVMLHQAGDVLWVDWKHSENAFGYSIRTEEGWTERIRLPWSDKTWVGAEEMRKIVRMEVLAP